MVFAINPNQGGVNNFDAFLALAKVTPPTSSSGKPPTSSTKTSSTAKPTGTSTANPTTHTIQVGNNGVLAYDPPFITGAKIGDTVKFVFHPKNHTVSEVCDTFMLS